MAKGKNKGAGSGKNVLVIGDWLVDENWVASIHRSSTSSRTGKKHFLGLNTINGATESLCGAGATAAVLKRAKGLDFNIIGLGIWHRGDTKILSNMLLPAKDDGGRACSHPSNLKRENPDSWKGVDLINLAGEDECNGDPNGNEGVTPNKGAGGGTKKNETKGCENPLVDYATTTKIVRVYEHNRNSVEINSRIDWESYPPPGQKYWAGGEDALSQSIDEYLSDRLEKIKGKIDAVVIKDLGKNVVCKPLINFIKKIIGKKRINKIPWYISTKSWMPDWLNEEVFKGMNVKLVMIPTVAAGKAIDSKSINRWVNPQGRATGQALSSMLTIRKKFGSKKAGDEEIGGPMVIALPSGHRVIALDSKRKQGKSNDPILLQLERDILKKGTVETQFASIIFGALVAKDLHKSPTNFGEFSKNVKRAVQFSREWMTTFVERLTKPENWDPSKSEVYLKTDNTDNDDGPYIWSTEKSVHTAISEWEQSRCPIRGADPIPETPLKEKASEPDTPGDASKKESAKKKEKTAGIGYGVIKGKKSKKGKEENHFDIWRAMNEIDGYACIVPEKRQKLQKLVSEMKRFKKSTRKESKSCLLIAPPGSGKTYLVKCLAKSINYHYHYFNIAQMHDKSALQGALEKLSTDMAHRSDKPWLVCFDEINKPIGSEYAYGSFLAPLEEGVFMRGDNLFKLDPCFWIFIGTKVPDEEKQKINTLCCGRASDLAVNQTPNWSDLRSRLTMPHINLNPNNRTGPVRPQSETQKNKLKQAIQLEMVYTAMAMLVNRFPDVKWVSMDVLRVFYDLGGHLTHREMKQFVRSLTSIQRGKVLLKNISQDWIEEKRLEWSGANSDDDNCAKSEVLQKIIESCNHKNNSPEKEVRIIS